MEIEGCPGIVLAGTTATITIPDAYAILPEGLIVRGLTHDQAVSWLTAQVQSACPWVRSFRVCGVKLRSPADVGSVASGAGGADPVVVIGVSHA